MGQPYLPRYIPNLFCSAPRGEFAVRSKTDGRYVTMALQPARDGSAKSLVWLCAIPAAARRMRRRCRQGVIFGSMYPQLFGLDVEPRGGPRGKRKSHRSLAVGRQAGRHGQRDDDRHSSRVRGVACSGRPASQHDQMARERVGRREGTGTGPGAEKSCLRSRLACAIIIDPFTYACTGYP